MKTITIVINPDATSTVEVNGMAGPSCVDLTQNIIQAVGVITNQRETDDFYKEPPRFEFLNREDA